MNLQQRIESLEKWGQTIAGLELEHITELYTKSNNKNGWFTPDSCAQAFSGILTWFESGALSNWVKSYTLPGSFTTKSIGLVMAGNIPLVGFHDFLCVLISGHIARVKMSSHDDVLLPYLTNLLIATDSQWATQFSFDERLNKVAAVIATGSDNSARYFDYYFRNIPTIIRKNRTSVAVVMGEESRKDLEDLGTDVFSYFGLGCRNTSKVFVPEDFDLKKLLDAFQKYHEVGNHHKYANNYDYQKTIRLVAQKEFLDSGFLILEKSEELVSPISVLYYETYRDQKHLNELLETKLDKIQCVVSAKGWFNGSTPFGFAQSPSITDYADNVDTLKFLSSL